jgi:hypothetical protein
MFMSFHTIISLIENNIASESLPCRFPPRRRRRPPIMQPQRPLIPRPSGRRCCHLGGGGGAPPVKERRDGEGSAAALHGRWWGACWGRRAARLRWPWPDALRRSSWRNGWSVVVFASGGGGDLGQIWALFAPIGTGTMASAKPSSVLRDALFFSGDPAGVTGDVRADGLANNGGGHRIPLAPRRTSTSCVSF